MAWDTHYWLKRVDKALDLLTRYVVVREREATVAEKVAEPYDPEKDPDVDGGGHG